MLAVKVQHCAGYKSCWINSDKANVQNLRGNIFQDSRCPRTFIQKKGVTLLKKKKYSTVVYSI